MTSLTDTDTLVSRSATIGPQRRTGGSGPAACRTASDAVAIPPERSVIGSLLPARDFTLADLPERIAARIIVDPLAGCWRGSTTLDRTRYASIDGQPMHRIVWQELVGEIPAGLVVDHVKKRGCAWNSCCLPLHLQPVPHRVNCLRGTSPAALNAVKTHCGTCGEPYCLINTYFTPDGRRDCRACIRRRVREYKARQSGALVTTMGLAA